MPTKKSPTPRVIVTAPFYREGKACISFLVSLADQFLPKTEFSVCCIVNNSKKEAVTKSIAFKSNQQTLRLLKSLKKGSLPIGLSAQEKNSCKKILNSGLDFSFIDLSSKDVAPKECTVGLARDIVCRAAANYFFSLNQPRGIIFITDGDCQLLPDATSRAVTELENNPGYSGAYGIQECYYPKDIKQADDLRLYFTIRKCILEISHLLKIQSHIPVEKNFHEIKMEGSCAFAYAETYLKVGGIKHRSGAEDYILGLELSQLGEIKKISAGVQFPLRPSDRTSPAESIGSLVKQGQMTISTPLLKFESIGYRLAMNRLIEAIGVHQDYTLFKKNNPDICDLVSKKLYQTLSHLVVTKEEFSVYPEKYFNLKEFIFFNVRPLFKTRFPDEPMVKVLTDIKMIFLKKVPTKLHLELRKKIQEKQKTFTHELLHSHSPLPLQTNYALAQSLLDVAQESLSKQ